MEQLLLDSQRRKTKTSELEVKFCGHRIGGYTARETFELTLSVIAGLIGGFSNLCDFSEDVSLHKQDFLIRNPKSYDEQFIKQIGDYYVWINYSNENKKQRLEDIIEKLDLQDKFYIRVN